tara:strand:+ start:487 stop:693 length:207 start_codon:yes stop_codon:yes gene_type:complete
MELLHKDPVVVAVAVILELQEDQLLVVVVRVEIIQEIKEQMVQLILEVVLVEVVIRFPLMMLHKVALV